MSTTNVMPTFIEIENARRRWVAGGHTVTRALIDIHEVNPDDPFGEPCWRINDGMVMFSTRDLVAQAPEPASKPNGVPSLNVKPTRPASPSDAGLAALAGATQAAPAENVGIQRLVVAKVRRDGGTQPRAALDEETISDYAEAMRAGERFPSVVAFYDGTDYWLADGFHRVNAAMRAGLVEIEVSVIAGTQRDAILYSVGANASHGLRRSNADKRRAVERLLRDDVWKKWSDREIARQCAVTQPFVSKVRAELSDNGYQIDGRTVTRNGTEYTMNTVAIGQSAQSEQIGRAPATTSPQPAATPVRIAPPATSPTTPVRIVPAPVSVGDPSAHDQPSPDKWAQIQRERQVSAEQVTAAVIGPAAATLADGLAANHPGAWRMIYQRTFGEDAPLETTVNDLINQLAVRWLKSVFTYDQLHILDIARPHAGALLAGYDLRAPWLDDAGFTFAQLDKRLSDMQPWLAGRINRWTSPDFLDKKLDEARGLADDLRATAHADDPGVAERQAAVSDLIQRLTDLAGAAAEITAAGINQNGWWSAGVKLLTVTDQELQSTVAATHPAIVRYVIACGADSDRRRQLIECFNCFNRP